MGHTPGEMIARLGQILAWGSLAISVGLLGAAVYLSTIVPASVPQSRRPGPDNFTFMLLAVAFSTLGAFLASRRERNRVAWLACAIGLGISLSGFGLYYTLVAEYSRPGQFPAVKLAFLAGDLGWTFALGVMLTFLPLLFPDGRLISARWRPVLWLGGVGIALAVLGSWMADLDPGLKSQGDVLQAISGSLLFLTVIAALASLVVRYRGAGSQQRLQLKWFIAAITLVGLLAAVQSLMAVLETQLPLNDLAIGVAYLCLPIGIAIAVFKSRLYEIDLVINRALVYGGLAAFITIVYVGVVVGIGTLVRSRGQFNLALSIVATALVAVAFQPVRQRVERWANQLVYGTRSTPYEALTDFSHRVAGAYADEEVLPRLARVLVEGTGATVASVWIRRAGDPIAAATWPDTASPLAADAADRVARVRHEGELLGELTVRKRSGEPFTPVEETLLLDLAAQAGQVLLNVRLTAELQARLREIAAQALELRASRQRIVAAQDAERRRLERNIHDGAQQHLAAIDNGVGFDPARTTATSGLQNMKDRVASVGGSLMVQSRPGQGTSVSGDLPMTLPLGVAP